MYDVFIIITLPLLWILLNVSSFIIITLHELGHAVPALLFSKKPVTVFIGTYGDNSGRKFNAGRLTFYIRHKFLFLKNRGLCVYNNKISFVKQTIVLLAGPLVTMLTTIYLGHLLFYADTDVYVKVAIATCLISIVINLVVSLFPGKIRVKNSDRFYYSDGYQIILWLENKANYENLSTACRHYDNNDFVNALSCLRNIEDNYMDESVFSLMLTCYVQLKNYSLAEKLNKKFEGKEWYKQISAKDYSLLAYANMQLKHYKSALVSLNKSIVVDPNMFQSLNNRGLLHNISGDHNAAKNDLNKAIYVNGTSSYAYSFRAYANLKIGRHGEAFDDIEQAITLDDTNPYAYLTMGIYLLHKNKSKEATSNFKKAKKLNKHILFIDEYLAPAVKVAKAKNQH